jgi:hypothetical protein
MNTRQTKSRHLDRRIRRFYEAMSEGDFEGCFAMIDPQVKRSSCSVTLRSYMQSLRAFMSRVGKIVVQSIDVVVHVGLTTSLYGDRDFATGQTVWLDKHGASHVFQERWVKGPRGWYTRSTGFVMPDPDWDEEQARS